MSALPTTIDDPALMTPSAVLLKDRLEENLRRMAMRTEGRGLRLRPHLKTAKCREVARMALGLPGTVGGTVSTVREAEFFAEGGVDDLFWAVTPHRAGAVRAAALVAGGLRLRLAVDSTAVVGMLAEVAGAQGVRLAVRMEIDCGDGRCGLLPRDPELLAVARAVEAAPELVLDGLFTHGGFSYGATGRSGFRDAAHREAMAVRTAAARLREVGIDPGTLSVGSTPTATVEETLPEINELRAGVYMFGDSYQAGIGSCAYDEIALGVLTTVLAHKPERHQLVVDAGALALSKDRSTATLKGAEDVGYGLVATLPDAKVLPGLRVAEVSQEHGLIRAEESLDLVAFPVGSRLLILPNHACLTAAGYAGYHVVDKGRIAAWWPRVNGW